MQMTNNNNYPAFDYEMFDSLCDLCKKEFYAVSFFITKYVKMS